MQILESLLSSLPSEEIPIRKVVVGIHWTAVCSKYCGLASTLVNQHHHGENSLRDVGSLHKKSAQELARWVLSENLLEASIGMAAINSILDVDNSQVVEINAADIIAREGHGKNIAVVGHFPFVSRLRGIAKNYWVIEKKPAEGDFPEQAAQELIPQADVVAITGTALINHTLEGLLRLCPPQAFMIVLGPSTPLTSRLFNFGISVISGTRVLDEEAALLTIQQGAIFPQIQGVRLLNLIAPGVASYGF